MTSITPSDLSPQSPVAVVPKHGGRRAGRIALGGVAVALVAGGIVAAQSGSGSHVAPPAIGDCFHGDWATADTVGLRKVDCSDASANYLVAARIIDGTSRCDGAELDATVDSVKLCLVPKS